MKKVRIKFTDNPTGMFNLGFNKGDVVEIDSKQAEEIIEAGFATKTDEKLTEYKERKKTNRSPVFDQIKSEIIEEIKKENKAEIIEEIKKEISEELRKEFKKEIEALTKQINKDPEESKDKKTKESGKENKGEQTQIV